MLRKPKDIDALYAEAADYDIILTTDAPLATALNMRISRPTLGKRAFTPKEVAAKYAYRYFNEALLSEGEAVARVAQRLAMPVKHVHNAMRQILEVRTHTTNVEQFLNETEKSVYRVISKLPTPQRARELFDPSVFDGKRVAVIGVELFNELDLLVLPDTYDAIDIFGEGAYDPAPLHILPGDDAVVTVLSPYLTEETENDIAIITSTSSGLTTRLKSQLYSAGVTINERLFLHDNLHVRGFLSFLSYSNKVKRTTVGEMRPFLESFCLNAKQKYDDYNLEDFALRHEDGKALLPLYELLVSCSEKSFGEAVMAYGKALGDDKMSPDARAVSLPIELNSVIGTLGLWNAHVTWQRLADLTYYIYNIPTKIESTKKGVVIVDCNQSLYVDRPVCIYIGLDGSWSKEQRTAPYIDTQRELERDLARFEAMLHQGSQRIYITTKMGEKESALPSYYFNIIYGRGIDGFDDTLFSPQYVPTLPIYTPAPVVVPMTIEGGELECFSQSSLNRFVTCPKQYEYSRLAPQRDRTYFLKGTLLHEFAEFYTSHPGFVKEKGPGFFAELLLEQYMGIEQPESRDMEYTSFSIAVRNIMAFVDSCDISEEISISGVEKQSWRDDNFISKKMGMPITSPNVELFFKDENIRLKGIIDLIINNSVIVDYKSSKTKKKPGEIMKLLSPSLYNDNVDFQPLVYLLKLRSESPHAQLSFMYCFFLANKQDVIAGKGNQKDNTIEVRYIPLTYAEFLSSPDVIRLLTTSKLREKFIEDTGAGALASYFATHPLPTSLAMDNTIGTSAYKTLMATHFGNATGTGDLLKEVVRLRKGASKHNRDEQILYLFKEDLDGFEAFLAEQLKRVAEYRTKGFPKSPLDWKLCKSCDYRDLCCEGW